MKPIAATLGWGGKVCILYRGDDGKKYILGRKTDMICHPEYYPDNCEWPIDPGTNKKLPIEENDDQKRNTKTGKASR